LNILEPPIFSTVTKCTRPQGNIERGAVELPIRPVEIGLGTFSSASHVHHEISSLGSIG